MKPTGITGRNHQMKSIYNTLRATEVRSWMSKQGVDFQGIQGRQVSQNRGLCRKSTLQGEQMQRWELYPPWGLRISRKEIRERGGPNH